MIIRQIKKTLLTSLRIYNIITISLVIQCIIQNIIRFKTGKYISIFHTIHEHKIELIMFTNNAISIFNINS